jgi:RecJ-like exonuclease
MNDRLLTKISIVGSIISVLTIYLLTFQLTSPSVKIGEIDKSFVGKAVNITGEVTSIAENEGNIFMQVKDETGEIKAVLWEDTIHSIDSSDIGKMNVGDRINMIGDIQIYRGELEIIPIRGSVNLNSD